MVAHLVRLKLTLLRNGLKRRPSQLIGMAIGVLYGGGAVTLAVGTLVVARLDSEQELAGAVITVVGSALVLAWLVIPLFVFGTDPTLDPRRFATYAIPSRQLAIGLAVSALVSLPAFGMAVVTMATVVPWTTSWGAGLVAVVSALAALATVILGSRVVTAWAAAILQTRRGRDAAVVATMVVILAYAVGASRLSTSVSEVTAEQLSGLASIVGWTPLGWAWAAPWKVASGDTVGGLLRLGLALALVVALLQAWSRAIDAIVENPRALAVTTRSGRMTGLGLFARLPGTPVGAIAARSLTMWRRDPRYQMSAVAIPLVPLVLLVAGFSGGEGASTVFLFMPVLLAFMVGFGPHNDVAYDDTAFWAHVASGVPGWADRLGRLVPYVLIWVVTTPVYVVFAGWRSGRWDLLPGMLGASVALAGVGWGIASVTSAMLPYPVPGPTESPFSTPPGSAGASLLAQSLFMGLALAFSSPVLAVLLWQVLGDAPGWSGWAALALGMVLAAVALLVGVRQGGAYLDRSGDRLLARLVRTR